MDGWWFEWQVLVCYFHSSGVCIKKHLFGEFANLSVRTDEISSSKYSVPCISFILSRLDILLQPAFYLTTFVKGNSALKSSIPEPKRSILALKLGNLVAIGQH